MINDCSEHGTYQCTHPIHTIREQAAKIESLSDQLAHALTVVSKYYWTHTRKSGVRADEAAMRLFNSIPGEAWRLASYDKPESSPANGLPKTDDCVK